MNTTETGSLQRAHALSAHASQLLHAPSPPLATLTAALESYRLATELFHAAAQAAAVDGATSRTLQMLVVQHRKLVRDLERRVTSAGVGAGAGAAAVHPGVRRAATVPAPSSRASISDAGKSTGAPAGLTAAGVDARLGATSPIKRPTDLPGLAGAVSVAQTGSSPFVASSASASAGATRALPGITGPALQTRSIPPFALRPPGTASTPVSGVSPPVDPFRQTPAKPIAPSHNPTLSPLYSSTSTTSSDPDPAESYVTFNRAGPSGDADPFSRFWGMLEDCLDQVSRPVAFTSAALGQGSTEQPDVRRRAEGGEDFMGVQTRGPGKVKDREEARSTVRTASPSESYYMISPDIPQATSTKAVIPDRKRTSSMSTKTPEELALENASLRASLDSLAQHAHEVDRENRELKMRSKERDDQLRHVAAGVRREAERARLDTSVLRSQLLSTPLAAAVLPGRAPTHRDPPATADRARGEGESALVPGLRKRVQELEEEVKVLHLESEKQKAQIVKYKDRFEKIKVNARAKKEARESLGGGDTAGTPGDVTG